MSDAITLVINLSAGDAGYGYQTAGHLARAHRDAVHEIIIIVDTIKAQHSAFYDHSKRYQEPAYSQNCAGIIAAAEKLKAEGLANRVAVLAQKRETSAICRRVLGCAVPETHDFRGAPIAAYIYGLELSKTRYVVHYDGDIILHQPSRRDWIYAGITQMTSYPNIVAASPRPAPSLMPSDMPFEDLAWFSTRCLLMDKEKIYNHLPLISGKYMAEVFARRLLRRTFPPAFETMLTHKLRSADYKTRYLLKEDAWYLHPEEKGVLFQRLLPAIIEHVEQGRYPAAQAGKETLDLAAWQDFLSQ